MRVGIDATWAAGVGGTASYTLGLVRALVERGDQEYVLFVRPGDAVNNPLHSLCSSGVRCREVAGGPQPSRSLLALARAARRDRLDIFYSPGYFLPLWNGPKVVTFHDANMFLQFARRFVPGKRLDTVSLCAQSLLSSRMAARIVADSHAAARDISRVFRVPAARLSVIYPGIDDSYFRDDLPDRSAGDKLEGDRFILTVGEISPQKNIPGLLRALASIETTDVDLVLAGPGDTGYLERTIFPLATRLGVERRVHALGVVSPETLRTLYSRAIALVHPSFAEGFGLPPVEAMASGTPVIASNRPSLPEVVGDAGLLVDPEDPGAIASAIDRIINDAALRGSLLERGRRRASCFRWSKTASAMLDLFFAVLQEARRAG